MMGLRRHHPTSEREASFRAMWIIAGSLFTLSGLCLTLLFTSRGDRAHELFGRSAAAPDGGVVAPASSYTAAAPIGVDPSAGVKLLDDRAFERMLGMATASARGRKMFDFTRDPPANSLQTLVNTWTEGSYSPVHRHAAYAESFVVLAGALAFFTFDAQAPHAPACHVLAPHGPLRGIVVEAREWHAMAAAPRALGYPGHAIVFETSGHTYDAAGAGAKLLAPWAPHGDGGLGGDAEHFAGLFAACPRAPAHHPHGARAARDELRPGADGAQ